MRRLSAVLTLWVAVLSTASCSYTTSGPNGSDPDLGYVDGLGLDSKFVPQPRGGACPNGPCYPVQQGFSNGVPAYFYNLGAVASSSSVFFDANGNFVVPTSLVTIQAFDFGGSSCTPPTNPYSFDPVSEAYPSNQQFPIFSALPLTSFVFGSVVSPMVAHYIATEPSTTTCQYLKTASSVGTKFGTSGGALKDYQMWPVIDVVTTGTVSATTGIVSSTGVNGANCAVTINGTQNSIPCPVQELPASSSVQTTCKTALNSCVGNCNSSVCNVACQSTYIACSTLEQQGWAADLQLTFMNGGQVPLKTPDPGGTFSYVEGVIVHPYGSGNLSRVTDPQVIILPQLPGTSANPNPNYSPIVRLHDFHVPQGVDLDATGNFFNTVYTGICPTGVGCQPNEVDLTQVPSATNVLFIVASAP